MHATPRISPVLPVSYNPSVPGCVAHLRSCLGIGDYADVLAASEPVELFDRTLNVLTLDALIASKRAAGRPKDLQVLPELEALREIADENEG
jgi:hypothetical protein